MPGTEKILILDPGHGGYDPGAIGNGLKESDINLILAKSVRSHLAPHPVKVLLTRENDTFLSLSDRAVVANTNNADYFMSIHVNAGGGTGYESYVHTASVGKRSDDLRKVIDTQVLQYLANYGMKAHGRSGKIANFAVLRLTKMPAVLVENLFIDNVADAALLKDSKFLDGLGNELAYGLVLALGL